MKKVDARRLLDEAGPSYVAELEPAKAARFKARTMLIPSVDQIRNAIVAIPAGKARQMREIREELARQAGADVTCPGASAKYWRLLAHIADEEGKTDFPWWRVTKDGKPNPILPGGEARHRQLLGAEGVRI